MCQCHTGFGYNPTTRTCARCPTGQGIDQTSNQCGVCKVGFGINPETFVCQQCPVAQGIDPTSGLCTSCGDDQGIHPKTKQCQKCEVNEGIDPTTRICGSCSAGFGLDTATGLCAKCTVENCLICTKNKGYCTFCSGKNSAIDGVCVPDQIVVVTPPPTPPPVLCNTKTDESMNTITIEKPNEEDTNNNNNTNFVVNIDPTEKTVVVEDIGQTQMDLVLNEKVNNITIQPTTSKPLDIVIHYTAGNPDETQTKPVITIDTSNVSNTDTSLRGEGQLMLQNKEESKEIELNKIVPNKDSQIVIESKSKVIVNQIDIYGNSKVSFSNSEEKAVVNSVTLQQKATTELDNVEISGDLKVGVSSLITLTENVDLSKASVELSRSSENQASDNPTIVGDLTSAPSELTILDSDAVTTLEGGNTNEFVIAESSLTKFDCEKWKKSFKPKPNSQLNNAVCRETSDRMKRLIANHEDKKLTPAAIAGIVVAVVVVVAVIIILIVYFVVCKRKANSQSEDESFDDNMSCSEIKI